MRYVSCRDNQGGVAEEAACAHLPKPPAREVCSVVACGQWKVLEWSAVRPSYCLSQNDNLKELHRHVYEPDVVVSKEISI